MTDYKALIEKARGAQAATYGVDMWSHEAFGRLADAVEALVAENERLEAENAKGGTIVKRAADMALRTPFSLQQATEALTFTTDVWTQFEAAKAERDALRAQLDNMCAHAFARLKFDGGRRAIVCTSCNLIVTHMEVSE